MFEIKQQILTVHAFWSHLLTDLGTQIFNDSKFSTVKLTFVQNLGSSWQFSQKKQINVLSADM